MMDPEYNMCVCVILSCEFNEALLPIHTDKTNRYRRMHGSTDDYLSSFTLLLFFDDFKLLALPLMLFIAACMKFDRILHRSTEMNETLFSPWV